MLKNVLKILVFFFFGIFGGIFGSQILWPLFVEKPLFLKYKLEPTPIYITEKKEIKVQENVVLKEAIEKTEKGVVFLRSKTKTGKTIEGSGLILTSDGVIITLAEMLPSGSNFFLFIEGEPLPFEILKKDNKENLALIKVERKNLKTAGFSNLEKIKLGERVFLVGKIFEEGGIKTVVNEGIIKKIDDNQIETNILESQNLAGSPLFDIEGNLIGLNFISKDGKVISIPNKKIRDFVGF